jgi:Mlc titration factor MtfA (ptsG expression regulator)
MFGLVSWLRRLRAARLPFPEAWRAILREQVPFYAQLAPATVSRFERKLQILVRTKHFEGAGGFVVDDRVRVVVAAAAARLIMNMPGQHYQRLGDIVVYPDDYRHPGGPHGQVVFGEAHHHGTVVLSWAAVQAGLGNPDDGHDTATHEFAHVLDAQDGNFDGTPVLKGFAAYGPWARVMSEEFLSLSGKRRRKGNRARQVLRQYGATNEAEFFAVATEAFFEKPRQMRARHPELHAALSEYFGVEDRRG